MTARDVDDAAKRLGELRLQTVEDAVLAALAFGLALAATQYRPSLAMPLALGAMAMTGLAGRAFVRRFLLVDELATDPDAYRIPAVHDFGVRSASVEHRRVIAATLRAFAAGSADERLALVRPELEELLCALGSDAVEWEPQTVVALEHWLADPDGSLRDVAVPAAVLRSRIRSVLAGLDQ